MKALAGGLLIAAACSATLLGQEQDRSLARISLALQQPPPVLRADPADSPAPKKWGPFTLIPPTGRGEIVRVSVPIGELISRAFQGVATANRRRREAAARREVEAAVEWFKAQQPPPKP
jgi:hypothetical protein